MIQVFVKVVLWTQGKFSNERGSAFAHPRVRLPYCSHCPRCHRLRLDESKPVASQYRNIAERLGLLAVSNYSSPSPDDPAGCCIQDFETHRLFMLSARKGEEYLVTSIVQDNEVPANVPGLDRACRMLFIDDFEGRACSPSSHC